MGKEEENTSFMCAVCKQFVSALKNGSYRNHCPFCLSSLHVDDLTPGDRASPCRGVMRAIGARYSGKKGWQIIHKCMSCDAKKLNKIAQGDIQSDNWDEIVRLSQIIQES